MSIQVRKGSDAVNTKGYILTTVLSATFLFSFLLLVVGTWQPVADLEQSVQIIEDNISVMKWDEAYEEWMKLQELWNRRVLVYAINTGHDDLDLFRISVELLGLYIGEKDPARAKEETLTIRSLISKL